MDRDLFNYYLGALGNKGLSRQALLVHAAMFGKHSDDLSRLNAVLASLQDQPRIEDDTESWLRHGIRGHYGGEGLTLEVSDDQEAGFWAALHRRFPAHPRLALTTAEAVGFSDEALALEALLQAFRGDASLMGEVYEDLLELLDGHPEHAATRMWKDWQDHHGQD